MDIAKKCKKIYGQDKPTEEQIKEFNDLFCIHKDAYSCTIKVHPEIENTVVGFLQKYKEEGLEEVRTEFDVIREILASAWSRVPENGIISQLYVRGNKKYTLKQEQCRNLKNVGEDIKARVEALPVGKKLDYISINDDCDFQPDTVRYYMNVDYGGSEGIYADIMAFTTKEDKRRDFYVVTFKTLDNGTDAFIYMSQLVAYIKFALSNDGFKLELNDKQKNKFIYKEDNENE